MIHYSSIFLRKNIEDVKKYLSVVNYPAQKVDIFSTALRHGANINVMTLIQTLPNQEFRTPREVLGSIGLN